MATRRLQNYLRMHRKRRGLTQKEVAYLLGCRSGSQISRYERFQRIPTLETVLIYEVVFRVPVRELFSGHFDEVERQTLRRVGRLAARLQHSQHDPRTDQKMESLAVAVRESGSVSDSKK